MKKDEVLKRAVISKLISESVSAENYDYNRAILILSDCVRGRLLTDYLRTNQEDIIKGLSQIKQQFTTNIITGMEDMPSEYDKIVTNNFWELF